MTRSAFRRLVAITAAMAAMTTMAACGSSEGGGSSQGSSNGSVSGEPEKNTNMEDVQALFDTALLTLVDISTVDPAIQETFEVAAAELPQETLDTALECWQSNDCEV